jgi:hypothetical protein
MGEVRGCEQKPPEQTAADGEEGQDADDPPLL